MRPCILAHCGAGSTQETLDAAQTAAEEGWRLLQGGASALDAVEAAVVVLEDDQRLNAGTGSRLTLEGQVEMDAGLMDSDLNCGSVGSISRVKNPIRVARKVMETPHVLLVGPAATAFARRMGFQDYDPTTPGALQTLQDAKRRWRAAELPPWAERWRNFRWGDTVGAVARDSRGGYAAAGSTGGVSLKLPGRVGDTPLVGCGLYAGPEGAVVSTGVGEEIVRKVLSKAVYDLMERGASPSEASSRGLSLFPSEISIGILALGPLAWSATCNASMAYAVQE
jgi:isoaspartyl peptidase/L-asparaginase-like protein (Ntn-hydrolase superfamily)